jgi:hypothetical protein
MARLMRMGTRTPPAPASAAKHGSPTRAKRLWRTQLQWTQGRHEDCCGQEGAGRLPRLPAMPEDRQSQLKLLIARGKEQGYLTYAQVNDHLPSEIVDPEQIEDIVNTINDMGIPVYEKGTGHRVVAVRGAFRAGRRRSHRGSRSRARRAGCGARSHDDPVRMYMREMGTVELLTREGEIRIAKRIEEGLDAVRTALSMYPADVRIPAAGVRAGEGGPGRLVDIIVGSSIRTPRHHRPAAEPTEDGSRRSRRAEEEEAEEGEDGEESEEAFDTGRIRKRPRAASRRSRRAYGSALAHIAKDGARPEDAQGPQEALGRDDGAEALAAHVRRADPEPSHARGGNPPAREGES